MMTDNRLEPLAPLRAKLRRDLSEAEWRGDDKVAALLASELQSLDEALKAGHLFWPKF